MELIEKMGFAPDTHEYRGKLIAPLRHALAEPIYPIWVELILHVFVPCLHNIPHMQESILLIHLPVCLLKVGKDFIKEI